MTRQKETTKIQNTKRSNMNALKTLVSMQLKDKVDLGFLRTKKALISKVVLTLLALIAITAVYYVIFYVCKLLRVFSLVDAIPTSVIVVVFTVMEILSIISCTYSLMKNLYFARDNQVLLTLPVTTDQIFFSKLIVYYIYELMRAMFFIFPLFFAFGLTSGYSILYFLWLIPCMLIVALIPVAIGALLSIFAMLISLVLRNYAIIRWVIFLALLGGGIYVFLLFVSLIPENLDIVASWGTIFWDIQDFLNSFTSAMAPFTYLTRFIVGSTAGLVHRLFTIDTLWTFLVIIAVVGTCLGLSYLICKPLFFKMTSSPFEYRRKLIHKTPKNRFLRAFYSAVFKDDLVIFRTSDEVYSLFGVAICMPLAILLLNTIFAAMSTRLLGDYMAICFNLLIICLFAMATNNKIASVYSREAQAGYLVKTRPNGHNSNLTAKLVSYAVVTTLSIIASVCVFASFNSLSVMNIILFGIVAILIYLIHMFWSAEMDIMNPQNIQYSTTGTHVSNPNETKSTIAMVFLAFVFFAISLFLCMEDIGVAWLKVMFIALIVLAYRIWSFYSKIKYYYEEKG